MLGTLHFCWDQGFLRFLVSVQFWSDFRFFSDFFGPVASSRYRSGRVPLDTGAEPRLLVCAIFLSSLCGIPVPEIWILRLLQRFPRLRASRFTS